MSDFKVGQTVISKMGGKIYWVDSPPHTVRTKRGAIVLKMHLSEYRYKQVIDINKGCKEAACDDYKLIDLTEPKAENDNSEE